MFLACAFACSQACNDPGTQLTTPLVPDDLPDAATPSDDTVDERAADAAPEVDATQQADTGPSDGGNDAADSAEDDAPAAAHRTMVVVAHQDDDIIVSVPDLMGLMRDGGPLQTVYVTSGDAGFKCDGYTRGREAGAKAQQAMLAGVPNDWIDSEHVVAGKHVRFSHLQQTQISMAFIGLPNPALGSAEPPEGALLKLWLHDLPSVSTLSLDGRSAVDSYTREDLIDVLKALMAEFELQDLRVLDASQLQLPYYPFEHVDHQGSAVFAFAAFQRYMRADTITFYPQYSVMFELPNLGDALVSLRLAVFDAYKVFDLKICTDVSTSICDQVTSCDPLSVYEKILARHYTHTTVRKPGTPIRTPSGACLEASGSALLARVCDAQSELQHFTVGQRGVIRSDASVLCLAAASADPGTALSLKTCERDPLQQFYVTTQGQLRGPDATCVRELQGQLTLEKCTMEMEQRGFALLDSSSASATPP